MHRFFVPSELVQHADVGSVVGLPDKLTHQVRDVLHIAVDEQLVLLDNSGEEFIAHVSKLSKAKIEVRILERRAGKAESPINIILCQGLLKSARFEWILEKGTELGISTFAPILCRRSMTGLEDAGLAKLQRWQRIVQEATEQCGRAHIPKLLPIRSLPHALQALQPFNDISDALSLMPWEEEHAQSLRNVLHTHKTQRANEADGQNQTVIVFIGPEGGLVPEEIELAQRYGVQTVTLGQRILRAETAAIATIANIMYEFE